MQRGHVVPRRRRPGGLRRVADRDAGEVHVRRRRPAQAPGAVAEHVDQEVGRRAGRGEEAHDLVLGREGRAGRRRLGAGGHGDGEHAGGRRQPVCAGLAVHQAGHGAGRAVVYRRPHDAAAPVAGDREGRLDLDRKARADAHQGLGEGDGEDPRGAGAERREGRRQIGGGGGVIGRHLVDRGEAHAPVAGGLHRDDARPRRRGALVVEPPEGVERAGAACVRRRRQRLGKLHLGGLAGDAGRARDGALVHPAVRQAEQHLRAHIAGIDGAVEDHAIRAAAGEPAGAAAVDERVRHMHHVAAGDGEALGRHLPAQAPAVVELARGLEVALHRRLRGRR